MQESPPFCLTPKAARLCQSSLAAPLPNLFYLSHFDRFCDLMIARGYLRDFEKGSLVATGGCHGALSRRKLKQFPSFLVCLPKHFGSEVADVVTAKRLKSESSIHRATELCKPRQISFVSNGAY